MLECREMDELLMDWLYDELDPRSSARVTEHVGACARCSAEVGAMRRTRHAFRDLSEVEPPPSMSAILLHEAARRAPAPAPSAATASDGRAWWARLVAWLRPLALHPTATALASMVVVAGVAGVLVLRGVGQKTAAERTIAAPSDQAPAALNEEAPAAPPQPPTLEAPQAASPEPAQVVPEGSAAAALADDGKATPLAQAGKGAVADKSADPAEGEKEKKRFARLEPKKAERDGRARIAAEEDAPSTSRSAFAPAASKGSLRRGYTPPIDDAEGGSAASPPPSARPAPARDADGADAPAELADRRDEDRMWLAARERALAGLVKDRLCADAASVANDIIDRDAEFYARRIAGNAALKPCERDVRAERSRRLARRKAADKSVSKRNAVEVEAAPPATTEKP